MEIASTSSFKIKGVGCKSVDFSDDVSLLPINSKLDLDPQILSRTRRDRNRNDSYDVVPPPKKRKHSDEQNPSKKRQKKTIEVNSTTKVCRSSEENPSKKRQKKTIQVDSTTKEKSITALGVSLHNKTDSKSKITKPVDPKVLTTKVTKPEKSIADSRLRDTKTNSKVTKSTKAKSSFTTSRIRIHDTKTKPNVITKPIDEIEIESKSGSFRDLIEKARKKLQEKRQLDNQNVDITSQRIAARLAINQVVATVEFNDHLKYHTELEKRGCEFIHDQVDCLDMFNLWSRSHYNDGYNSLFENNEMPRSEDEDSMRKKQKRSTKDISMEHHSLQDTQITKNGESAQSSIIKGEAIAKAQQQQTKEGET